MMTTTNFDKKVICNDEFVAIRVIENMEELNVGGIVLASTMEANSRMALGQIESLGTKAKEEYGIEEGDYVYFDRLSTFGHTAPVALTRYNNVLFKTNKEADEYFPLKNMYFVEEIVSENISNVKGFYIKNYGEKMKKGKIVKKNCEIDTQFNIGDTIVLTTGADDIQIGKHKFKIYKHDMIVAKILED